MYVRDRKIWKHCMHRSRIPKRTIEEWDRGTRKCPHWAELLILEKLERIAADNEEKAE